MARMKEMYTGMFVVERKRLSLILNKIYFADHLYSQDFGPNKGFCHPE